MNWLIDTQLPHQLATALKKRGHTAVHASELPAGHTTTDEAIIAQAERTTSVVVTKDADFLAAYELKGLPKRMVYVSTGNMRNADLIFLFMRFLDDLCAALENGGLVELGRDTLIVR